MKCEELLAILNEYVDGEIDPGICDEYREHLEKCNPCQVVVDNIRGTIQLYREGQELELDEAFQCRLNDALARRWHKRFGPR